MSLDASPDPSPDVVVHPEQVATRPPLLFQGHMVHHQIDPFQLMRSQFNMGRLQGTEPHTIEVFVAANGLVPLDLVPAEASIVSTYEHADGTSMFARHPLGSMLFNVTSRNVGLTVGAATIERCQQMIEQMAALIPDEGTPTSSVSIWSAGGDSPKRRSLPLEHQPWAESARNYPDAVRRQLEQLVGMQPPFDGGRLLGFHGEPGTGKTNAIRSLIGEWSSWCEAHFLAEPEAFLASAMALDTVVHALPPIHRSRSFDEREELGPEWKLIVAEDTDELLRAATNHQSGGALGRLFNAADGLLGEGTKALFLITTNEPVHRLHPALLRPGRCLARIEFERFDVAEAAEWMPAERRREVTSPATLAELYELRGDIERIEHVAAPARVGGYL